MPRWISWRPAERFVRVGERGSFTLGAEAAGVPQPVASRRVAALERHFGQRLFDRTTRRAALTPFGREMMGPAKRLVDLADGLADAAEQARLRPLAVALPDDTPIREMALLRAAARADGTVLDLRTAGRIDRERLLRAGTVQVALLPAGPAEADWTVRLGVAGAHAGPSAGALRVETLRPSRARGRAVRRLWLQPEDEVAHVVDVLLRLTARAGLLPVQLGVAGSLTEAVAEVLRGRDLLICSAAQAERLDLRWRPLHADPVVRGYRVAAAENDDAVDLRGRWHARMAACLGAA